MKQASLLIDRLIVGQLATNCYLLTDRITQETLIVDPGDDAEYITECLNRLQTKPKAIVATHGHFDHILAVRALQLAYRIPFFLHPADLFLVKQMAVRANHYLPEKIKDPPPVVTKTLADRDELTIGKLAFRVSATPGHTPGSVSLYCQSEKIVLVGDLVFAHGAVGRTDFSYSDNSGLRQSLQKIFSLPAYTVVYPGHGEPTTIEREKIFFNKLE